MSLLDELLKKAMEVNRAPVQSEVPGGLLALLTQGNQNTGPQVDINSFLHQNVQPATVPAAPQMQHGSGLGKEVVSSLLGEWFDERKYKNDLERAEKERKRQAEELEKINKSGLSGKDLYFALLNARSKSAQDVGKKGLEPLDPEKTKIVEVGVPNQPGMRQQAIVDPITKAVTPIGEPWAPSSLVNVYNGDGFIQPATADEKVAFGLSPHQPATKNLKTGEVKATPTGITEAQSKAGMNVSGLTKAISDLEPLLVPGKTDISKNKTDFVASEVNKLNIPFVSPVANQFMSEDQQKFNSAAEATIISVGHLLSGQGLPESEVERKSRALVPQWGDKNYSQKLKGLQALERAGATLAGPAFMDALKQIETTGDYKEPGKESTKDIKKFQPVERSVSKSGKPMFKNANGQWEYE